MLPSTVSLQPAPVLSLPAPTNPWIFPWNWLWFFVSSFSICCSLVSYNSWFIHQNSPSLSTVPYPCPSPLSEFNPGDFINFSNPFPNPCRTSDPLDHLHTCHDLNLIQSTLDQFSAHVCLTVHIFLAVGNVEWIDLRPAPISERSIWHACFFVQAAASTVRFLVV